MQVEGPCLVILKDGTVAQSHVPEADYRLPYAMETHAVKMTTLQPEPAADSIWYGDPKGAIAIPAQKFLVSSLPVIGIVTAYLAARFAKYLKVRLTSWVPKLHQSIDNVLFPGMPLSARQTGSVVCAMDRVFRKIALAAAGTGAMMAEII